MPTSNLSLPVRGATQTAATLNDLQHAKGTLFVRDGVIRESKHPVGRAFLGLFSSRIRTENHAAHEVVRQAVRQTYGFEMGDRASISGAKLSRLTGGVKEQNRAFMTRFLAKMTHDFGESRVASVQAALGSSAFASGLRPREMMREVHERLALGQAGERFRGDDVSTDEIFQTMNSMPRFKELLASTFGVADPPNQPNLTIEAHTRRVMGQYEQQKAHYDLQGVEASLRGQPGFENFNADRFMKMVLLFHDIGKGEATQTGREQHEVTLPILRDAMMKLGFSEQEVRLAANLVDNDLLGEWQSGKRHDVTETRSRLRALAQDSGVPLKAFLTMQKLFYISDASSYPTLRAAFMREDGNHKLHFRENKTDELIDAFGDQFDKELPTLVIDRLLAPNALIGGDIHPLELFAPDTTTGKAWNVYDLSRAVLAGEAGLRTHIESLGEPLKTTAQTRLNEAVEMAKMAVAMDADRWTPEHTQGVIVARLEIRNAGITANLPTRLDATSGAQMNFGAIDQLASLRGPGSPTAQFYHLVDAKGGNSHMLQCISQQQVTSSWCGTSLAVKGYLEQARSVSETRYFHPGQGVDLVGTVSRDSATACYARFSQAPGSYWDGVHGQLFASPDGQVEQRELLGTVDAANIARIDPEGNAEANARSFDTSIRYQIAMQMEMLPNMDFPGNNPANGTVTVYRAESAAVMRMYGLDIPAGQNEPPALASDSQVGTTLQIRRSTYDSGSLYSPVVATGGTYTTTQEVPYHRIFGSFLLGANETSTQSCLYTDLMHEVIFMTEGIPSTYRGGTMDVYNQFQNDYLPPAAPPAASPAGSGT
jgi:hypothetical protein